MKNWKTTLFGTLFALATAISLNPDLIYELFPKDENPNLAWNIIRVAKLLVFVFGVVMAAVMKDRNVTGGTVPLTGGKKFAGGKSVIGLVLAAALLLNGCAGWQPKTQFGRNALAWWQAPATQQGVEYAKQAAFSFAINAAAVALAQYAGDGTVDFKQVAATTLFQQASNIRQLQGTHQVLDAEAMAVLLQQGGSSEEISRWLAGQLALSAGQLVKQGVAPDVAAELNAAAFDAKAMEILAR